MQNHFMNQSRILAAQSHPNIVSVLESGEGTIFLPKYIPWPGVNLSHSNEEMKNQLEHTIATRDYLQGVEETLSFISEAKVPQTLQREKLEWLYAQVHQIESAYIVQEYAPRPNLFQFIERQPLSEAAARTCFKQIIDASAYLSRNGVAHLDIKPENYLVDADFSLKLADFGFAIELGKLKNGITYQSRGTAGY